MEGRPTSTPPPVWRKSANAYHQRYHKVKPQNVVFMHVCHVATERHHEVKTQSLTLCSKIH